MTDQLRTFLATILDWQDAHAAFDAAVDSLAPALRGRRPEGAPHSVWELVEHIRLAQRDILDFCRDADYQARSWPDEYWPNTPAPPSATAWNDSIARYHTDVAAFQQFVRDPAFDPFATVPWGNGQTLMREVVLTADHTAYHVGQIVLVRQLLGAWA